MPPDTATITLEDALLKAFNLESLKRMTRRRLGLTLENEIGLHKGLKYIVADLVEVALREGWRDDLLRAALAENERNPYLEQVAIGVSITTPSPHPISANGRVDSGTLEKLVRERGVFLKWQDYVRKMSALGYHMCRIEVPTGEPAGTGWLVAADLVLTNYHVIEDVHKNNVLARDVTCRFDYFVDNAQGRPLGGVACALAPGWLVDWSPYSDADVRADAPQPTAEQVDYALIRLDHSVGDDSVTGTGGKRGWVVLNANPPVVMAEDVLLIPQFPDGRSLELTFGKALEYNDPGTRLRHDANTEPGASGSPCLTISLEPFALHHASGPGRSLRYNQCVPLRLVIQRMIKQRINPFWEA